MYMTLLYLICLLFNLISGPSSPKNVTAIGNGSVIMVSWLPPDQLNGPTVNYSVSYYGYKKVCESVGWDANRTLHAGLIYM